MLPNMLSNLTFDDSDVARCTDEQRITRPEVGDQR
jgi:hypothetical protein